MGETFSRALGYEEQELNRIRDTSSRVFNVLTQNYRGLLGFFVPLFYGIATIQRKSDYVAKARFVWFAMAWSAFTHPVSVPIVGLYPVFLLPLLGVMSSANTCGNYFDSFTCLLVVGGWCLQMLNNSGFTRRGIAKFLCSDTRNSPNFVMLKIALAAFIFSAISHRLLVTSEMISIITPVLMNTHTAFGGIDKNMDFNRLRYILCCLVHTSAAFGSLVFMHTSYTGIVTFSMWSSFARNNTKYKEIFNYLSYTAFALPTCIAMFVVNLLFFMFVLSVLKRRKRISADALEDILRGFKQRCDDIGRFTLHEMLTIGFTVCLHLLLLERSSKYFKGWADFSLKNGIPRVEDACIFAIFAIFLHIMPKGFSFIKYVTADRVRKLPPRKPESAVLFWKFVDKNTPYAYLFLMGAGPVLVQMIKSNEDMLEKVKDMFSFYTTDKSFMVSTLMICIFGGIACNLITGTAAAVVFVPTVVFAATEHPYVTTLAAGLSCSFGFMSPFLHTTTYYSRFIGRTPVKYLICFNFWTTLFSELILWAMLTFLAPMLFEGKPDKPLPKEGDEGNKGDKTAELL